MRVVVVVFVVQAFHSSSYVLTFFFVLSLEKTVRFFSSIPKRTYFAPMTTEFISIVDITIFFFRPSFFGKSTAHFVKDRIPSQKFSNSFSFFFTHIRDIFIFFPFFTFSALHTVVYYLRIRILRDRSYVSQVTIPPLHPSSAREYFRSFYRYKRKSLSCFYSLPRANNRKNNKNLYTYDSIYAHTRTPLFP